MTIEETNKQNPIDLLDAATSLSLKTNKNVNMRYILSNILNTGFDRYTEMEYDLSEHGRIIDCESFVASAFKKKRQAITKEGIEIVGDNQRNINYINKRLEEFEYTTGISFEMFMDEVVENLVNFNNCFILKYRNENNSTGNVRYIGEREIKPISGIYVLAAPTIDTANDKKGNIVKYRHRITNELTKIFKAEDILHIYHNKRTGVTIGTPPLEAVKDDIRALRNIEECTELLIYRHASPFIHVQVGDKDKPAGKLIDGTPEVNLYSSIIDNMNESGGVATPHRVKINMLGSESQAMRLESYLTYYRDRVLAGLNISQVDLAIGGNTTGGSAGIISQTLKDDVRAYQKTISTFISNLLFNELLLESDYYKNQINIPKKDRVYLSFNENDLDARVKLESHYLNMYQGGLITKDFAAKHIKDMTKEDIQEDKDSSPTPTKSGQGANRNALIKSSVSSGKKIKDSFDLHYDKESDIIDILEYAENKMLLSSINYDIIENIYDNVIELRDSFNKEELIDLIINSLISELLKEGD